MNTFPITLLDNFLKNPDSIRNFALSLKFNPSPGHHPGKRTNCISQFHPGFFNEINQKILSLFFPIDTSLNKENFQFKAQSYFNLSKNLENTGWIHRDDGIVLTAMIYLSPSDPNINRGTSFYTVKSNLIHYHKNEDDLLLEQNMSNHYKSGKLDPKLQQQKEEYEKTSYDKVLDVKDKYNRLVTFDPVSLFHKNNNINSLNSPDRLTFITFFESIKSYNVFPITRCKMFLN